jgi:LuxR family maltose regulon positive regulatory protein
MVTLSKRERQVLELVAAGNTTKAIAERLSISEPTVKWHVSRAARKLGAQSRTEAVALAIGRGYIRAPNDD